MANDNFKSHSFIYVIPPERTVDFEVNQKTQTKQVDIAIIFWVDLRKIAPNKDSIFIEDLKKDIEAKLSFGTSVTDINRVWDDEVQDIFKEFDIDKFNKELLMYPYKAIRYECEITYETFCQ